jgi:hypothetical protein
MRSLETTTRECYGLRRHEYQHGMMDGHRNLWTRSSIVVALLTSGCMLYAAKAAAVSGLFGTSPMVIEVRSEAITAFDPHDPSRHRFGQLEFRGGLTLKSPSREFGGLSAMRFLADGAHFISLTDRGKWLSARLTYEGEHPTGVADAVMAPILGGDGYALAGRGWQDTESIADNDGTLYVGIEGANKVLRFDFSKDGLRARGRPISAPLELHTLPKNQGLEALVVVPRNQPIGGTLIAISERGLDRAGNIRAFLIGGPTPGVFSVKRSKQFDITDAALLPSGDLLILERSLSWPDGLLIQIRRIPIQDVRPGATVDGVAIFEADLRFEIDNMEGLAVHQFPDGTIVLTLVSDDNFSALQRTLLLQFTFVGQRVQ